MTFLMCRACGEFVQAFPRDDGDLEPRTDACPSCDGTEFKDNESGETYQTE
jgi:hypothetical protein